MMSSPLLRRGLPELPLPHEPLLLAIGIPPLRLLLRPQRHLRLDPTLTTEVKTSRAAKARLREGRRLERHGRRFTTLLVRLLHRSPLVFLSTSLTDDLLFATTLGGLHLVTLVLLLLLLLLLLLAHQSPLSILLSAIGLHSTRHAVVLLSLLRSGGLIAAHITAVECRKRIGD